MEFQSCSDCKFHSTGLKDNWETVHWCSCLDGIDYITGKLHTKTEICRKVRKGAFCEHWEPNCKTKIREKIKSLFNKNCKETPSFRCG